MCRQPPLTQGLRYRAACDVAVPDVAAATVFSLPVQVLMFLLTRWRHDRQAGANRATMTVATSSCAFNCTVKYRLNITMVRAAGLLACNLGC